MNKVVWRTVSYWSDVCPSDGGINGVDLTIPLLSDVYLQILSNFKPLNRMQGVFVYSHVA